MTCYHDNMLKKCLHFHFILILALGLVASSCIETKIEVKAKKKNTNFSISQVRIQNNQLFISGSNLTDAENIRLVRSGFDERFTVESNSGTQIVANGMRNLSIGVGQVFDLILSNASGAATFNVDFTLSNHSVALTKLSITGASAGQVLKFDGTNWVPASLTEAQIYAGTWNASNNIGGVPDLSSVSTTPGEYYIASHAGTLNGVSYAIGDWIISDGYQWQKIAASKTSVTSFQGRQGIVTLTPADYVSLKDSVSHKVTGSSINDLADIDLSTPPTNGQVLVYSTAGGLNKWIPGTAAAAGIDLTDLSGAAPITYNSSTGVFAISAATTSDPGSMSAADKTKLDGLTAIPTTGDGLLERFSSTLAMKTCSAGEFLVWYSVTGWTCTTGVSLPGTSAQTLGMQRNTTSDTAGNTLTIQASGATSSATNKAGGSLVLSSGTSTGSASSIIEFKTATASGAGTTDRTPSTKMTILGSGNVGIGTTNPNSKLDVQGQGRFTYTSGTLGDGALLFDRNSTVSLWGMRVSDQGSGEDLLFERNSGGNWESVLSLNRVSGNVGIGTTAPQSKFDVVSSELNNIQTMRIVAGSDGAGHTAGLSFSTRAGNGDHVAKSAIYHYQDVNGDWGRGSLAFAVNGALWSTEVSTADEKMRIDYNGNVGIGTTSPSSALHVVGGSNALLVDSGGFHDFGYFKNGAGQLHFYTQGGSATVTLAAKDSSAAATTAFAINSGGSDRLTVLPSGNIGIATTNPRVPLEISGAGTAGILTELQRFAFVNTDYYSSIKVATGGLDGQNKLGFFVTKGGVESNPLLLTDTDVIINPNAYLGVGATTPLTLLHVKTPTNGATVATFESGSGSCTITPISGVNCSSDLRLKENVENIINGLDKVLHLRGVTFKWKDRDSKDESRHIGFIAQEVEKVAPELVKEDVSGYKQVNYANFVAVLTEAIKELYNKHVVGLYKRLASSEGRIQTLELENARLKKESDKMNARLMILERALLQK